MDHQPGASGAIYVPKDAHKRSNFRKPPRAQVLNNFQNKNAKQHIMQAHINSINEQLQVDEEQLSHKGHHAKKKKHVGFI